MIFIRNPPVRSSGSEHFIVYTHGGCGYVRWAPVTATRGLLSVGAGGELIDSLASGMIYPFVRRRPPPGGLDLFVLFVMLELLLALVFLVYFLSGTPRGFRSIVVCAYVLRVLLVYMHAYIVPLPDSQFDALRFESVAWLWAQDGQCFDDFTTGSLLYSWIGSCVYLVFGRSAVLLQLINSFLGTVIVLVAMQTMLVLASRRPYYRYVGWFLAMHPSLLLYSAITMREVVVVLASVISIYWLVRWRRGSKYRHALWAIVWMLVSQMFHTGMITGTVTIVTLVLYHTVMVHWRGFLRIRTSVRNANATALSLIAISSMVLAISFMLSTGYGLDKLTRLFSMDIFEALSGWQSEASRGRAGYLYGVTGDRLVVLLMQIPLRVIFFLGAPFFWMVAKLRDMWGLVDGVFLLALLVLIVRQVRAGMLRHQVYRSIALVTFAMILGFAVVTSNYGTAFRHRAKFVPVIVVLYVYGRSASEVGRRHSPLSTA